MNKIFVILANETQNLFGNSLSYQKIFRSIVIDLKRLHISIIINNFLFFYRYVICVCYLYRAVQLFQL